MLLVPAGDEVPSSLEAVEANPSDHERFLSQMQQLRGRLYLNDGAIETWQLDAEGRHKLKVDDQSWHLLCLNAENEVAGCARLRMYDDSPCFDCLGVSRASIATCSDWGPRLRIAIQSEIERAKAQNYAYFELGGWALSEELRMTTEALRMVMTAFALGQHVGGALGVTTATVRNRSAMILRRLGGMSLNANGIEIPPYFDPQYGCQMEVLRFDSSASNPKYHDWLDSMISYLAKARVITTQN